MKNNPPSSELDLPSEGEIYGYYNNNPNINKPVFQSNDDNSNTNILNQQGDIPLNKYFQKPIINNSSNQNIKNNNVINKENSISDNISKDSAAPPLEVKEIKIATSKDNIENNENRRYKFNIENKNINEIKNLKSQQSINTQPNIINIKTKKEVNKFKEYSYLILFYLSSIINNVLLYFIISIIDRIRGVNE